MWLPSSNVSDSRWTIISVSTICAPISPATIPHSIRPESFGTFLLSLEIHADILRRMTRRVPHSLRGLVLSSIALPYGHSTHSKALGRQLLVRSAGSNGRRDDLLRLLPRKLFQ